MTLTRLPGRDVAVTTPSLQAISQNHHRLYSTRSVPAYVYVYVCVCVSECDTVSVSSITKTVTKTISAFSASRYVNILVINMTHNNWKNILTI